MVALTCLSCVTLLITFQLLTSCQQTHCCILPYEGHLLHNSSSSPSSSSLSSSSPSSTSPSASSSSLLWTLPSVASPLNQLPSASVASSDVNSIFKSSTYTVTPVPAAEKGRARAKRGQRAHRAKRSDQQEQSATGPKEIKMLAGQTVKIHCRLQQVTGQMTLTVETSGDSLPLESTKSELSYTFLDEVYWFRDVKRLPMNKRQEVYENGTLVLRDLVKSDDAGIYTCTTSPTLSMAASESSSDSIRSATSPAGDLMQRSIRITVLLPPMIVPFEFPKSIQQGMRVRLLCSIMQGDPPFKFSWLKDGKRLDPSPLSLGVRSDDYSMDLTFSRVTTRHNGNYTCVASNDVAFVAHSTTLLVQVPPHWKIEPMDASVTLGQNVLIDCLSEGVPSPVMTWERGLSSSPSSTASNLFHQVTSALSTSSISLSLPSASSSSSSSSSSSPSLLGPSSVSGPRYYSVIPSGPHFEVYVNGSLLIKNTVEEDAGYYLCQASNSIGPGLSKVIQLTVHVPPRFTSNFQSETVKIGDSIVLKCEAIGDNPMSIVWSMDKQIIASQPGQSSPTIPGSSSEQGQSPSSGATSNLSGSGGPSTSEQGVSRYERKDEISGRRLVSSLKISSARRKDSALFTCYVTNAYGESEMNIRLIVQEPPESPREVNLVDVSSRSMKLSWTTPFHGNNQITKYWINCHTRKSHHENGTSQHQQLPPPPPPPQSSSSTRAIEFHSSMSSSSSFSGYTNGNFNSINDETSHKDGSLMIKVPGLAQISTGPTGASGIFSSSPSALSASSSSTSNAASSASTDDSIVESVAVEDGTSVIIRGLKPATRYHCSVRAENEIGFSTATSPLTVLTDEEAPAGPPLLVKAEPIDFRSARISWKTPERSTWNGLLRGYYVGYKVTRSLDQFLYKTIDIATAISSNFKVVTSSSPAVSATGLNHVIDFKFNDVDDGTSNNNGPLRTLSGHMRSNLGQSHHRKNGNSETTGPSGSSRNSAKLTFDPSDRTSLAPHESNPQDNSVILTGLKPQTEYTILVQAYNSMGAGPQSDEVTVTTLEEVTTTTGAPGSASISIQVSSTTFTSATLILSPKSESLVSSSSSSHSSSLDSDGGWDESPSSIGNGSGAPDSDSVTSSINHVAASPSSNFRRYDLYYRISGPVLVASSSLSPSSSSSSSAIGPVPSSSSLLSSPSAISSASPFPSAVTSTAIASNSYSLVEWQMKPVYAKLNITTGESGTSGSSSSGPSESSTMVTLDNLACGTSYLTYAVESETGARTETITFRTAAKAPVAPKKEKVLKLVNQSSIYIYPSSWSQSSSASMSACPISKLTIEYKSNHQKTWKLLSSSPLPLEQDDASLIEVSNLTPRSIYSIRITAHTKGSLSTMAEYEVRVGFGDAEDDSISDTSSMSSTNQSGYIGRMVDFSTRLMVDTSTIISLISSLIVLLIGFIAVACLIAYKRKLNNKLYTRHTTYSSSSSINGASSNHGHHTSGLHAIGGGGHSSSTPSAYKSSTSQQQQQQQLSQGLMKTPTGRLINPSVIPAIQKQKLPPIPVQSGGPGESMSMACNPNEIKSTPPTPGLVSLLSQQAAQQQSNNLLLTGKSTTYGSSSSSSASNLLPKGKSFASAGVDSTSGAVSGGAAMAAIRGRLPAVSIPRKQLEQLENDIYSEYDEITPYATFSRVTGLTNSTDDLTEEFKTFTVRIGEPAYCFKGAMDAPSKLLTSSAFGTMSTNGTLAVEYKMSACSKAHMDPEYQCSQVHSITSTGSSNHTELFRAYEFGKRLRDSITGGQVKNVPPVNRQTLLVQTHNSEGQTYYEPSNVTTVTEDDDATDPPTDPGIRRFTKSPPRPNEQRIGGCYNRLYKVTESLDPKVRASRKGGRRQGRKKQKHDLPDLTDDSTDDGIIGNDDDVDEGEGVKDDEDSDQSILTASPALSEEMRSNASDESSMVTPTNDLEDEDVDDEEDEDEDEEEDEVSDEKDTNGDTVDGSNDGTSDGQVTKRSTFESTVESSTCNEPVAIDHRRSMNRRSNSHWSVRPNVSYITSEAIAIKSSVQLSHSSNGNGQSSFHSKNNDRTSHNRADGGHSRGHKNLTSSPVTPSGSGRDESGITTCASSSSAGTSKVHSVQSVQSSSRTSFDRQMHPTSGGKSQLLPANNSPQFTSQPQSSLQQHRKQVASASGQLITSAASSSSKTNSATNALQNCKRPPQRTKSTTDEIEC